MYEGNAQIQKAVHAYKPSPLAKYTYSLARVSLCPPHAGVLLWAPLVCGGACCACELRWNPHDRLKKEFTSINECSLFKCGAQRHKQPSA